MSAIADPIHRPILSFDLDDTLWDNASVMRRAQTALFEHLDRQVPGHFGADAATLQRYWQEYVGAHVEMRHDLPRLRQRFLSEWFARRDTHAGGIVDLAWAEREAERAYAVFDRERQRVQPHAGVDTLLQSLGARFTLVAISNGTVEVMALAIGRHFRMAVNAHKVGYRKPDPRIFHWTLQQLGFAVGAVPMVHVGDCPNDDVGGALAAGIEAIWFNPVGVDRPAQWPARVREVSRLDDLPTVLGEMMPV